MESELASRDHLVASKADLREGLQGLELKLETVRGELIREIKGASIDSIRWNFAFWVAQLAAIAGVLKLLR
jgi:hypothetical protein